MFYENFKRLCEQNHISESAAVQAIGLNRSAVTRWRNGALPSAEKLHSLAKYFGASEKDLMNGHDGDSSKDAEKSADTHIRRMRAKKRVDGLLQPSWGINVFIEEAHFEERSFIEFVLKILSLYYPGENEDSLIEKLDMPAETSRVLQDESVDKIPVDAGWCNRLYSLFDGNNILQLSDNLHRMWGILHLGYMSLTLKKLNKIIAGYMYKNGVYNFDFSLSIADRPSPNGSDSYTAIYLKDRHKQWVFAYHEFSPFQTTPDSVFLKDMFNWASNLVSVERFCILFIYAPHSGKNGDIFEIKQRLIKVFYRKLTPVPTDTQLWLLQLHSETRDIMAEEEIQLNTWASQE